MKEGLPFFRTPGRTTLLRCPQNTDIAALRSNAPVTRIFSPRSFLVLRQGIKTKTGRSFTRFSIKSILQNPVYLIADKDAYQYFVDNEAELFAPESGKRASPPS